jgi:hypothetical protein
MAISGRVENVQSLVEALCPCIRCICRLAHDCRRHQADTARTWRRHDCRRHYC